MNKKDKEKTIEFIEKVYNGEIILNENARPFILVHPKDLEKTKKILGEFLDDK